MHCFPPLAYKYAQPPLQFLSLNLFDYYARAYPCLYVCDKIYTWLILAVEQLVANLHPSYLL